MRRPDILLVNPWIHDYAAYDLWARPLGLLMLASWLRKIGWEPHWLDCLDPDHPGMATPKKKPYGQGRFVRTPIQPPAILRGIPRTLSRYGVHPEVIEQDLHSIPRPKVILLTSFMTYWYTGVQETVTVLRRVFPDVPIILGGIYASLMPDHAARVIGADEVVSGPGERRLGTLLSHYSGIGPSYESAPTKLEFDPALDLLRTVSFLPLMTSRGCPFRCSYCASGRIMPSFVQRPFRKVISWLEAAQERFGCHDVVLYDDAFLVNWQSHALPILEASAERLPGMRWHSPNGLHAAAITPRLARAMKRAGFETIRLGIETTSDDFHARTGKKTSRQDFLTAVKNLHDNGFPPDRIGVYLLVGLPGQKKEEIERDVEAVLAVGAYPKLAEYSPLPGTPMWSAACAAARYPIHEEPLFHNCTLLPVAQHDVTWEFLHEMRKKIISYMRCGVTSPANHPLAGDIGDES